MITTQISGRQTVAHEPRVALWPLECGFSTKYHVRACTYSRLRLRGPCVEVGFQPGRVYFEEELLEEVGVLIGQAMGDAVQQALGHVARGRHMIHAQAE